MEKSFEQGQAEIAKLCAHFATNRQKFLEPGFKEAHVRQTLIDPMFEALGWDVANKGMAAPQYREVVPEDSLDIEGKQKAPDYAFRVGTLPKFFVEAKKCGVNIGTDPAPAFQLRRYGWSAKVAVSILTDFEELAVYDCTMRPRDREKASRARILFLRYDEYPDRWRELWDIFSRESVWSGKFDQYAASKRKRGTSEVDVEFLKEIESWRESLARNIALRNKDISSEDLNTAVQLTIDRIVFLRMAEDRGLESDGQLLKLCERENIYLRFMKEHCRRADEKYNSGLFHFQKEDGVDEPPDNITPKLAIDDRVFKPILQSLYFEHGSPYFFGVMPVEILGTVYERFLGKVIRLTTGHQAKIEEKPEVRKAGGVYYTPAHIVEYIVKQTVGRQVEGKSPAQLAGGKKGEPFRVLDMACGSGSFLLGAYQYLLNHCLAWYAAHDPAAHKNAVYLDPRSREWRLSIEEKKRILTTHIFGVDIDPQAVEVSKLSLLLKVLESETAESVDRQLRLFRERALPNLAENIKCGNSLIGPDYFSGKLIKDTGEIRRVNPFDWKVGFPKAMKQGGFDCIIGNPPYVRQEALSALKQYLAANFRCFHSSADLFAYFMERAVALLRTGGHFSYIVSSSFLRTSYGESLRRQLKDSAAVLRIVDFGGLAVFESAKDTYVCIPLLAKVNQPRRIEIAKIPSLSVKNLEGYVAENLFTIPHERLNAESWSLSSDIEASLFSRLLKSGQPLGEYVDRKMFYGIKTGFNQAFEITENQRTILIRGNPQSRCLVKPFVGGSEIRRYTIRNERRYLIVIPSGWTRINMAKRQRNNSKPSERDAWNWFLEKHTSIAEHLWPFVDACRQRDDQGEYWWELRPCDYYEYFDRPKLIFPDICKSPRFVHETSGMYLANTAYCLGTDDLYLLGFLNSRLFWFAISNISIPFGVRAGQYRYRLIYQYMEKVPIRVIDPSDSLDIARRDRIVSLVESMLAMHERLAGIESVQLRTVIQRQIDATDREIDRLVYELYGLTDKEIELVEGVAANAS